jgi:enoyl-CoA hydratase/carnithine racemase
MSKRPVLIEKKGTIVFLILNRPKQSNLVDEELAWAIKDSCRFINEDSSIRVMILTGTETCFSTGRQTFPDSMPPYPDDWINKMQTAASIAKVNIPTIAAINGDALDHGLELALACDLRVADWNARLGFRDLSRGLFPWDGGTQRLSRIVGRSTALDLLLTSRILTAKKALAVGLINHVTRQGNALNYAVNLASSISELAPIAMRYTKEAIHRGLDMPLDQGLKLEADLSFLLHGTTDRSEGIDSFLTKRDPYFLGQ